MMESPVDRLLVQLRSWLPWRRQGAAAALGRAGDARAVEPLIRALSDWHAGVRRAAAAALGCLGDARAVVPLVRRLADKETRTRQAAARSLAGSDAVRDAVRLVRGVVRAVSDGTPWPPDAAGQANSALLGPALTAAPVRVRQAMLAEAALVLEEAGNRLIREIDTPSVRSERAIQVLADLDDERAIGPLVAILCARDSQRLAAVVQAADAALRVLSPGRETALARAALHRAVHLDVGLTLRHVGRLMEGSPEYTITSPRVRQLLLEPGRRSVHGLFEALGLDHPNEARAVANLLRVFGGYEVAAGVLNVLALSEHASVYAVQAVWRESPLLWRRVVEQWSAAWPADRLRLLGLLDSQVSWARLWAADAIGRSRDEDALDPLRALLCSAQPESRLAAAVGLAHHQSLVALDPLLRGLETADRGPCLVVATALSRLGVQAGPALARIRELQLAEGHPDARRILREAGDRIEDALRGAPTELLAAGAPTGLGTELEASTRPVGTGTELEAGPRDAHAAGGPAEGG